MAITVKHSKVSTIPDADDDALVRPSDWNDDHVLTGTVPVANGGTGAATLTGYVKGNGTANMTAAATIPNTDITGLGTASTKDAGAALGVATLDAGGKVPVSELPAAVLGALSYQGTWDASTNTPTLTSSVGTKGYYYVVNVAGNTNLNGITDWLVGDWAVYNGTIWQKVDNTETVTSVNGQTGAVVLTTTNVAEGTNLYYTDARARAAISAGTGISYVSGTGVITNAAPDQTVVLNAGTGISTSGTYPNFTITNTSPSLGGDVVGPASATDNAVARFDTTTGKLIQNSLVIIGDTGSVTGVNSLTAESLTVNNNATLGSSNTDTLEVNARITTDLEPNTDAAKDIGTSGRNWRDGFFSRNLQAEGKVVSPHFDALNSAGGQLRNSSGTAQLQWGGGGGNNVSVDVAININPANAQVDLSPTGTGTVRIAPATAGTMNNMVIGGTTPLAGSFTDLSVTGTTSFDGSQGTAGQVLTSAGTGNTPTWTTPTTGTVTSVTGTAPIVSSGGNTPAISIPQATGSVNGFLSSTDWTTFNNKTSNTGTVTSVAASAGTGISVSGSPITTSGTLTITNTGVTSAVAGTGITVSGATGAVTVNSVAAGAPAFNATLSGDQIIAASTYTKVSFNTTSVNLGSCYDAATNYRFTPTTAGYYYVSVKLNMRGYGSTNCTTYLVGNGGSQQASTIMLQSGYGYFSYVDKLLYFNGSTDYVEVWWSSGTLEHIAGGGIESMFKAYFVRG